jgi:catechol-2,3-dioxygenase
MKPIRKSRENEHEIIELVIGVEDNLVFFEIDNSPILTLMHDPEASRPYHNSASLFHFANLTPDRKACLIHLYILRIKVLSSQGLLTTW